MEGLWGWVCRDKGCGFSHASRGCRFPQLLRVQSLCYGLDIPRVFLRAISIPFTPSHCILMHLNWLFVSWTHSCRITDKIVGLFERSNNLVGYVNLSIFSYVQWSFQFALVGLEELALPGFKARIFLLSHSSISQQPRKPDKVRCFQPPLSLLSPSPGLLGWTAAEK